MRTSNRRVLVCSFGQHPGTVTGAGGIAGWLRVSLDRGDAWHGHRDLVRRLSPRTIAAHLEYLALSSHPKEASNA